MKFKTAAALLLVTGCLMASCTYGDNTPTDTASDPDASDTVTPSGWQTQDGRPVYYLEDGSIAVGWIHVDGAMRYFLEDGTPATGWVEVQDALCYFLEGGVPATDWLRVGEYTYYFNANGAPVTGWLELDGRRYCFDADGIMLTGWHEVGAVRYFFRPDGAMAVGQCMVEGSLEYFTETGIHVPLVNPWRSVPDSYAPNLLPIGDGHYVETSCYTALMEMLEDCRAAGYAPVVCSAYRTQAKQEYLFQRKVDYYLDLDYEQEEAEDLAATTVARPGTSEHQLGLALDIIDEDFPYLTDEQADTATQQWLMEHCWEYGFILRYPEGTTEITGIIYEPWHYRYVGREVAAQIHAQGITLEEFLGFKPE